MLFKIIEQGNITQVLFKINMLFKIIGNIPQEHGCRFSANVGSR